MKTTLLELRNNVETFSKLNSISLDDPEKTLSVIEFLDELDRHLKTINKFDNKFKEDNNITEIIEKDDEDELRRVNDKYSSEILKAFSKEVEIKEDLKIPLKCLRNFSVEQVRFLLDKEIAVKEKKDS